MPQEERLKLSAKSQLLKYSWINNWVKSVFVPRGAKPVFYDNEVFGLVTHTEGIQI